MTTAEFVTLCIVLCATPFDLSSRRIPNFLTYSGIFIGLVLLLLGFTALESAIVGFASLFGVSLFAYSFGALGGGDVKILTAIGLIAGFEQGVLILLISWSAASLAWLISVARLKFVINKDPEHTDRVNPNLPLAPALLIGCLVTFFVL